MNKFAYVITYRGNKLDTFSPNGLPIATKTGISIKDVISFSKKSCMIFDTKEEADNFIQYMLHETDTEAKRYDDAIHGSSINIISTINKCKSEPITYDPDDYIKL